MTDTTLHGQLLLLQGCLSDLDLTKDAQGQVGTRKYRYLTLDKLHAQVLPRLGALGLVWLTFPTTVGGHPALRYVLRHVESGEEVEDTMPLLLSDQTSQGLGSAITYARRYCLSAVIGLIPEDDDDGAAASRQQALAAAFPAPVAPSRQVTVGPQPTTVVRPATGKQRGLINHKASEKGLSALALAGIVANATTGGGVSFTDIGDAEAYLGRVMDRLPIGAVNPILAAIEHS